MGKRNHLQEIYAREAICEGCSRALTVSRPARAIYGEAEGIH